MNVFRSTTNQIGPGAPQGFVLDLLARPGQREVFRQNAELPSVGDRSVFTHDLYRAGDWVGFDGGITTVVRIDEGVPQILCAVSMNIEGGSLAFQTFMPEFFPPPPFWTAVCGGTGEFAGARGQMHINPASENEHFYSLHIY